MRRVRQTATKNQRRVTREVPHAIPLDDGTVTTPAALAMIQMLIPLGLQAVEEQLLAEVTALAGPRYAAICRSVYWPAPAPRETDGKHPPTGPPHHRQAACLPWSAVLW